MAKSAKTRATLPRSGKKAGDGELGGFTIIEVVLVLAIAALIFLMVFIALPTLQRNQRDTQRRNDLARVSTQLTNWQSNNSGKLPGVGYVDAYTEDEAELGDDGPYQCVRQGAGDHSKDVDCLITNYLNGADATMNTFVDPSGWAYGITVAELSKGDEKILTNADFGEEATNPYMIYIYKKAKCDDEYAVFSNNSRDYAVQYKLEGNGVYCKDNQ